MAIQKKTLWRGFAAAAAVLLATTLNVQPEALLVTQSPKAS
jgi:hypothetical protein